MRFVKKTAVTTDGEIAEKEAHELDEEQVAKEELYDGFYAVMTIFDGDIEEIIKINKQRWEIEKNFRIMKTEFEARPVYVRRDDRIKAHFMTCYISLLLYHLSEEKIGSSYTAEQIIESLRSMKMTLLNTSNGYVPSYTRTEITDSLHKAFGFRTDYEFIKKSTMRSIIKQTKEINLPQAKKYSTIAHIAAKPKTATSLDFTGFVTVFCFLTVKDGIIYMDGCRVKLCM